MTFTCGSTEIRETVNFVFERLSSVSWLKPQLNFRSFGTFERSSSSSPISEQYKTESSPKFGFKLAHPGSGMRPSAEEKIASVLPKHI